MAVPFDMSGDLDLDALRKETSYMIRAGVHGLVVGGSTGEGHTLTKDELREACGAVKDTAKTQVGSEFPVLAGVITNSTREAVEYCIEAKKAGVDGLQVTPVPHYNFKPRIEGHIELFNAVGEACGLPIVIYNVVSTNKLDANDIQEISLHAKQIAGVKQSGLDIHTLGDVILAVGNRIAVLSALDDMLLPSLAIGSKGAISAMCAVLPELHVQLYNKWKQGRYEECLALHWKIFRVARTVVCPARWRIFR